jgi:hypothetical protein
MNEGIAELDPPRSDLCGAAAGPKIEGDQGGKY